MQLDEPVAGAELAEAVLEGVVVSTEPATKELDDLDQFNRINGLDENMVMVSGAHW